MRFKTQLSVSVHSPMQLIMWLKLALFPGSTQLFNVGCQVEPGDEASRSSDHAHWVNDVTACPVTSPINQAFLIFLVYVENMGRLWKKVTPTSQKNCVQRGQARLT